MPRSDPPAPPPLSSLLERTRRAVQRTGLTADPSVLEPGLRLLVVSGRLAQTTLRHLERIAPPVAQRLVEELRALGSPQEVELLLEDRSFTFFHVVQHLFGFATHHLREPAFCAGVGRGGGGVEVAPDREVTCLLSLLSAALPPGDDSGQLGRLLQTLVPRVLEKVFAPGLFRVDTGPQAGHRLQVTLRWAAPEELKAALGPLGLAQDAGPFFLNSALLVEGTLRLGCDTLVHQAEDRVAVLGLVAQQPPAQQEQIAEAGCCPWVLAWHPHTELRRLSGADEVLARAMAVYDALHRKDLQYYLERIKGLEGRVQALEARDRCGELIGGSPPMRRVYQTIQQVADTDLTVLIRGESGTGKELVARAIHASSPRSDRPFVALNCAAFAETLLESELFGHEKGAFTGADRQRTGRFEAADGGTLFLDEVGDVPLTTQVKLLRVLDTRTFERVGGNRPLQVDVRILAATNRDLEALIAQGTFRRDFYFRLNVLPLRLPPLREHPQDIPLLARHFLERTRQRTGRPVVGLAAGALQVLARHSWPGNTRELLNVVERAVVVHSRGPTLTAAEVELALGAWETAPAAALNLRQRRLLERLAVADGRCRAQDLLDAVRQGAPGAGDSRRTLQNDLRRLDTMGLATYVKHGSARLWSLTPAGLEELGRSDPAAPVLPSSPSRIPRE
ncbi:MAG: sigma-54 dependent transcriptional regulator [Candidatus Latescibacterota bacterium]